MENKKNEVVLDLLSDLESYCGLCTILCETEKYINDHYIPEGVQDDVYALLKHIIDVRNKASSVKYKLKQGLGE